MSPMKLLICLAVLSTCGLAQAESDQRRKKFQNLSTGRTPPEGQANCTQGWTGPTNTSTGGAPAESAGPSPPGMQAAPEGSTKTVVEPDK